MWDWINCLVPGFDPSQIFKWESSDYHVSFFKDVNHDNPTLVNAEHIFHPVCITAVYRLGVCYLEVKGFMCQRSQTHTVYNSLAYIGSASCWCWMPHPPFLLLYYTACQQDPESFKRRTNISQNKRIIFSLIWWKNYIMTIISWLVINDY